MSTRDKTENRLGTAFVLSFFASIAATFVAMFGLVFRVSWLFVIGVALMLSLSAFRWWFRRWFKRRHP